MNTIETKLLTELLKDSKSDYRDGSMFLNLDNDKFMIDVSLDEDDGTKFECNVFGEDDRIEITDDQKQLVYDHLHVILQTEIQAQREFEKNYESEDHNLFI